jgi:hypothetical protein
MVSKIIRIKKSSIRHYSHTFNPNTQEAEGEDQKPGLQFKTDSKKPRYQVSDFLL